jgi:acetyltransferase-like isoleucine patch superfamily enzyme
MRLFFDRLLCFFYYEPLFKTQCEEVGRNFRLIAGIPLLLGTPIRLVIGNDVKISGITTFVGSKQARYPVLRIGSGSSIGHETGIVTGRGIYIGERVRIGNRVFIAADDSHPVDPDARRQNLPPPAEAVKEIWIDDDAEIGYGAVILKGVRVGTHSIIRPKAVVTKSVPPYSIVSGNPACVEKSI